MYVGKREGEGCMWEGEREVGGVCGKGKRVGVGKGRRVGKRKEEGVRE